jgi:hypothetical protein
VAGLERHSLLLFGWLLLTTPFAVQAQFSYATNNGTITIWGTPDAYGAVVIPDTVNGLPVTAIGGDAFLFDDRLTSITIPNSVTTIGGKAFEWCTSLTNVTIGNGVTSIGDGAFNSCRGLTSVIIPNSVTSIGTSGGWYVFDGVVYDDGAFENCTNLTSVTIPNGVTSIGGAAFFGCTHLTNVTIGGGVASIGTGAFNSCGSLTSVSIPSSVTNIEEAAFGSGGNLSAINVETNNPVYSSVSGVLFNKSQTTLIQYPLGKVGSYSIPNTVTTIGDDAFESCWNLTSVTIPNSVTTIEHDAFVGCTSLTNITIPYSVTSIADAAPFVMCRNLSAINVETKNPVYSSVVGVLFNKSQTTLVECPPGKVGSYSIPNTVTTIGNDAFESCEWLTSVTVPNSVSYIGDYAFGQSSVGGLYFQGNAPGFGGYAFGASEGGPVLYYLPGTTGWASTGPSFAVALWSLPYPLILNNSLGVRSDQFGFTVSWATNLSVVVEAATSLSSPLWQPVQTNNLVGGSFYFSDPQWANYSSRFYRVRSQ